MQGRFHFYEGYAPAMLALGVRAMRRLGVETLLVTNAAGGVNLSYRPGTLMAISDHINFARVNPLIGENDDDFGPRFPDQSRVYDPALRAGSAARGGRRGRGRAGGRIHDVHRPVL